MRDDFVQKFSSFVEEMRSPTGTSASRMSRAEESASLSSETTYVAKSRYLRSYVTL